MSVMAVRIRTARKQQCCDGYPCRTPIMPGERYEEHRQSPGSYDWGDYDHWVTHKVHHPSSPWSGPDGCELAAAYQENAKREAAATAGAA